jgi:hypothetical protein
MRLEETHACAEFHPEEAGIMLDRLALELVHALAKNPGAVPALQIEAAELLDCVGAWLAATDPDALPMSSQLVAAELEPSVLAETLQDLGHDLLMLAAVSNAANRRSL